MMRTMSPMKMYSQARPQGEELVLAHVEGLAVMDAEHMDFPDESFEDFHAGGAGDERQIGGEGHRAAGADPDAAGEATRIASLEVEVDPDRRAQIMDNAAPMRAFMLGEGFPPLTSAQVRAVRCPVLLVNGSLDDVVDPFSADVIEAGLSGAIVRRHSLTATGHVATHGPQVAELATLILEGPYRAQ